MPKGKELDINPRNKEFSAKCSAVLPPYLPVTDFKHLVKHSFLFTL